MLISFFMGGCLSAIPIRHFSDKPLLDGMDVVGEQEEFNHVCSDALAAAELLISGIQSLEPFTLEKSALLTECLQRSEALQSRILLIKRL
jgi:hypothetical protein